MSNSFLAAMYMLGTLLSAAISPACGVAMDRYGARIMVPVGIVVTSSGLLLVGFVPTEHRLTPALLVLAFWLVRGGCKVRRNPHPHASTLRISGSRDAAWTVVPRAFLLTLLVRFGSRACCRPTAGRW